MSYDICGIPITKEHALKIAQTTYKIMRDYPTGNRAQDAHDLHEARERLITVQSDIREDKIQQPLGS